MTRLRLLVRLVEWVNDLLGSNDQPRLFAMAMQGC